MMNYIKPNFKISPHPSFSRRRQSIVIEQEWLKLARQRLEDILANKVEMIPLEIMLNRIQRLLSK